MSGLVKLAKRFTTVKIFYKTIKLSILAADNLYPGEENY